MLLAGGGPALETIVPSATPFTIDMSQFGANPVAGASATTSPAILTVMPLGWWVLLIVLLITVTYGIFVTFRKNKKI